MADKDISEKILMRHADVFADCENVLTYEGERRVHAENLQPAPTESFYRGKERVRNQFCDVSFYLVKRGRIKAQYIIENETRLKRKTVLRKASYQGGAYREQLETGKPVYPVISMVADWTGKGTTIPLSLHELLARSGTPKRELKTVDDVKLAVHHMKKLPEEVRKRFQSDMGFVVDFLSEGSFEGRKGQRIVHGEALCEMMEALTGDVRFTELIEELQRKQRGGEETIMCEYIDMLEARGEKRGERMLSKLLTELHGQGREEDVWLAVKDETARARFYKEFSIAE